MTQYKLSDILRALEAEHCGNENCGLVHDVLEDILAIWEESAAGPMYIATLFRLAGIEVDS